MTDNPENSTPNPTPGHPVQSFTPIVLRPHHDGWTTPRQIAFVEALADCGCVDEACKRDGKSRTAAYALRRHAAAKLIHQLHQLRRHQLRADFSDDLVRRTNLSACPFRRHDRKLMKENDIQNWHSPCFSQGTVFRASRKPTTMTASITIVPTTSPVPPSLIARSHTVLGVCEGIGEDLGFNPLWLRLAFACGIFFAPLAVIAAYLALGVVVAASRWAYPVAYAAAAPEIVVEAEADEEYRIAA